MNQRILATALIASSALSAAPGCIFIATDRGDSTRLSAAEAAGTPEYSPSETIPGVRERYRDQLARLRPGMSTEEFRQALPGAVYVERRDTDRGTFDAYSLTVSERMRYRGSRYAFTHTDEAWFYFRDDQFVKWGKPREWPE